MKLTKSMVSMVAALVTTVGYAGFSTPFILDMIRGTRIARESESVAYSTTWESVPSDATAVVSVNGTTLITATEEGSVTWTPATNGTYTLTHKVMSRGTQHGETLTTTFKVVRPEVGDFKVVRPEVGDVVAKQRYPWNGLVDITCTVSGINGTTNGLYFALEAVMPDSGKVRYCSQFWVVQNGAKATDRKVHTNGDYRLVWDAQEDLGAVVYSNMVMRVTVEGHDKVQLWEGGPYWADTNIGAEDPWEYGYYFWWGDVVGSSSNFSFRESYTPTYGKDRSTLKSEGWITADGVLAPEHDAAHVQWGGSWRMPTAGELYDLNDKCDWTWTTMNGVNGYVVRGRGDYASNSIFLPCAGYRAGVSRFHVGSYGHYWSSVPSSDNDRWSDPNADYSIWAWYLHFNSSYHSTDNFNYDRYYGLSVRPVQGFVE